MFHWYLYTKIGSYTSKVDFFLYWSIGRQLQKHEKRDEKVEEKKRRMFVETQERNVEGVPDERKV